MKSREGNDMSAMRSIFGRVISSLDPFNDRLTKLFQPLLLSKNALIARMNFGASSINSSSDFQTILKSTSRY